MNLDFNPETNRLKVKIGLYNSDDSDDSDPDQTSIDYGSVGDISEEGGTLDFTNELELDEDLDYNSDLSISLDTKSVSERSQESYRERSFESNKSNKRGKYGTSESIEGDFTGDNDNQLTLGIYYLHLFGTDHFLNYITMSNLQYNILYFVCYYHYRE